MTWTELVLAAQLLGLGVVRGGESGAPAFRGAEGFGAAVKGGRGGQAIWVTNLNSHGPGSLRAAVDTPGPRIVRFKLAGTIDLGRDALRVGFPFRPTWKELRAQGRKDTEMQSPYSFVTVDGASAPPPGITISGNVMLGPYGLEEVIVRHLRIRDNGLTPRSSSDCLGVYARRVFIDHCSLQWARDEVASVWYENGRDVTIQWCIIGPGSGAHALGFLSGNGTDRITLHHCLFANNVGRNPRVAGNCETGQIGKFPNDTPTIDVRNNVIYNWFNVGTAQLAAGAHCNLVGNLYLPGPDSAKDGFTFYAYCSSKTKPTEMHLRGNICPRRPTDDMDEWAGAGHYATRNGRTERVPGPHEWGRRRETPFPAPPVATHSASAARALVLSQAGAWPRDAVDAGVVRTVLHNTGAVTVKNTIPSDYTNARPSVRAAASPVEGGAPCAVKFEATAEDPDGKIELHAWDFGDGERAVGRSVTHAYGGAGDYTVTAFALDDRGMTGTAALRLSLKQDGFEAQPVQALSGAAVSGAPSATPRWTPPTIALKPALAAPPTAEDWSAAVRLAPFIDQASWKRAPGDKLDARLTYDAEQLYVRVTTDFPQNRLSLIKSSDEFLSLPRHGLEYIAYPKVTAFFSPRHGKTPWRRFAANYGASRHDAEGPDRFWNPASDWSVRSRRVGQRWELTMAIPRAAAGLKGGDGASGPAQEAPVKPGGGDGGPAGVPAPKSAAGEPSAWGLKLMVNIAKDEIYIWPPVGEAGKDMHCAPHSSDPAYYAVMRFP